MVITSYNEEANIERVITDLIKELDSLKINYEIIAVDNGSADKTREKIAGFAGKNVRLVAVPVNIGYGNGILSGLKVASARYIGYMWGDNEISSSYVPRLYKLLESGADLAKIKRIARWYGMFRKIQSKVYTTLSGILFGFRSDDVNGCPKIMKAEYLKRMRLSSKDWFLDTEVMAMAKKLGMRIVEIDAEYVRRRGGKSKMGMTSGLFTFASLVSFRIKMIFRDL